MMYTASACNLGVIGKRDFLEIFQLNSLETSRRTKTLLRVCPMMLFCKNSQGLALCHIPGNVKPLCS